MKQTTEKLQKRIKLYGILIWVLVIFQCLFLVINFLDNGPNAIITKFIMLTLIFVCFIYIWMMDNLRQVYSIILEIRKEDY
jgi:hypothetical protein